MDLQDLDRAVAKALNYTMPAGTWNLIDWPIVLDNDFLVLPPGGGHDGYTPMLDRGGQVFQPSVCWGIGGPIIERERIGIEANDTSDGPWAAMLFRQPHTAQFGPTPLIAAMRAYVTSKRDSPIAASGNQPERSVE